MLKYLYNPYNDCVQIQKDYTIKISQQLKDIKLSKKNKPLNILDLDYSNVYSTNGNINSKEIDKQLSNIKHIGFEVTDSCNLQCYYCAYGGFYNNYDFRGNNEIDFKKAKLLIDFLIKKINSSANEAFTKNVYVSFYGGEPLLNINFIKQMVSYTQTFTNKNLIFHYMITTNAIYLRKYICFLSQHKFIITVSLDGSKENNNYRKFPNGSPSFDIIYNNLKYVKNNHPDYFKNNINFNAVMHNLNNLQEVFSFFYYHFGKVPNFSRINPTGVKEEKKEYFKKICSVKSHNKNEALDRKIEETLDLEYNYLKDLQRFIFTYSGNKFDSYNELLVNKKNIQHTPTATCFPFSKRIFMTVNNKIFPCERIGSRFALGKITEEKVDIDCEDIAQTYNTYYKSLSTQCTNCYNKMHCTECMFSISNLQDNPICSKKADKQKFDKYLTFNLDILSNQPILYRRIMKEIMIAK